MSGKRNPIPNVRATGGDETGLSPRERVDHDLPPDLKPFEAALASISPKTDRLDHDLIMFRAGQRSVAGRANRVSSARSLAMPAGLGGMTVLATILFVMLLARPVVERVEIVRVPAVESGKTVSQKSRAVAEHEPDASNGGSANGGSANGGSANGGSALAHDAASRSTQSSNLLRGRPRSRALKLELFARMLQEDAPPRAIPVSDAAGPSRDIPQPARPVPYIERLRDILDGQARAESPSRRPITSFYPGADS